MHEDIVKIVVEMREEIEGIKEELSPITNALQAEADEAHANGKHGVVSQKLGEIQQVYVDAGLPSLEKYLMLLENALIRERRKQA